MITTPNVSGNRVRAPFDHCVVVGEVSAVLMILRNW